MHFAFRYFHIRHSLQQFYARFQRYDRPQYPNNQSGKRRQDFARSKLGLRPTECDYLAASCSYRRRYLVMLDACGGIGEPISHRADGCHSPAPGRISQFRAKRVSISRPAEGCHSPAPGRISQFRAKRVSISRPTEGFYTPAPGRISPFVANSYFGPVRHGGCHRICPENVPSLGLFGTGAGELGVGAFRAERTFRRRFVCLSICLANEVAEDIRLYLDGHFTQVPPGLYDTGFEVRWEPQPSYPAPRPPVSSSPSRGGYRQQDFRLNRAESSYSARDDYAASPDYFERDVNTLNRCFDDIERFVSRVQSAALEARAQLPPESEFVAIFQKFRLCFNLLAKLKNHIHEPNAPELLHFLFTPLVLILDACKWGLGRNVAQNVVSPLLTREAKDLLLNCLTSKEMDVWMSMGEAWRTAAQDWPHPAPNSYTPAFDGLPSSIRSSPPVNGNGNGVEPVARQRFDYERERLAVKEEALRERERMLEEEKQSLRHMKRRLDEERRSIASDHPPHLEDDFPSRRVNRSRVDLHREPQRGIERDIPMTLSRSNEYSPHQLSYLDKLRAHRSKAMQVTYDRGGQNSKELTVKKGDHPEVLNDSRKWWECKNASGRIGFVPNTILTVVDPSTTKTYQNGGTRSSHDEPLFVRPGCSNSALLHTRIKKETSAVDPPVRTAIPILLVIQTRPSI